MAERREEYLCSEYTVQQWRDKHIDNPKTFKIVRYNNRALNPVRFEPVELKRVRRVKNRNALRMKRVPRKLLRRWQDSYDREKEFREYEGYAQPKIKMEVPEVFDKWGEVEEELDEDFT